MSSGVGGDREAQDIMTFSRSRTAAFAVVSRLGAVLCGDSKIVDPPQCACDNCSSYVTHGAGRLKSLDTAVVVSDIIKYFFILNTLAIDGC